MRLSQMIPKKGIVVDLDGKGKSKQEILQALTDILFDELGINEPNITREEIFEGLVQREREQSTALGEGFAFPHARFQNLNNYYMLIAISRDGIEFDALDGQPSNFFVMSLAPISKANLLLQTRAAVMRFFMPELTRKAILSADNSDEIWEMLDSSDIEIDHDILAKDIMRPQVGSIEKDATLAEAARALHKFHTDSLPIIDEDNKFVGDISCYDLFSYGLPNFFKTMKKISFVKHMDPFEKYFQVDTQLKISEMKIDRKYPVIEADATLMEIVFELTAHSRHLLYVLDNGKLAGVIDRYSIVDKVLVAT